MNQSNAPRWRITGQVFLALIPLLLLGCNRDDNNSLPGTLEWDRVGVLAEAPRAVIEVLVKEGDQVQAGQVLLRLDARDAEATVAQAMAEMTRLRAQLDELHRGTRAETIAAQRATVTRAETDVLNLQRNRDRAAELRQQGLNSPADLDNAETALKMAHANVQTLQAQLQELIKGPRPEVIAQAEAALKSAQANVQLQKLRRERLDVIAPRPGRVDALPFRLGDQPQTGVTLVSLLVGEAPYARVYVPERLRATIRQGDRYEIYVDGIERPFAATVRSIRSQSSFTPYFALSGDDASRLVYRAELVLHDSGAHQLPAGIPCHAERVNHE